MKRAMVRLAMLVSLAAFVAIIGGCSKKQENTAVGTLVGAGLGAGIGAAAGGDGALIGAPIGAIVGGLFGNAVTKDEPTEKATS